MSHPRIDRFDELERLPGSAASLGYRMPAEWQAQACVWVTRPHNVETWPLCLERAQEQFEFWIDQMRRFVPICMTAELGIATDDSWIRDYGPIFVTRDGSPRPGASPIAVHDFHFNGWGGKYEHRQADDVVPQRIALSLGLPIQVHDMVLEGGAIDVNGCGTVMSTEQCLLNPNRNAQMSKAEIEQQLHAALGTRHVIWLPGGIEGDDTDGHIDDVARFVGPGTVVAISAPPGHVDHAMTCRNLEVLRAARDQDGHRLEVIELPVPEPIEYAYPADRFGPGGRALVPASYANFLISNGSVFVPVFGQASDERALRVIESALPGRSVVAIPSQWLVVGLGALHCLSQQQPAAGGVDGSG